MTRHVRPPKARHTRRFELNLLEPFDLIPRWLKLVADVRFNSVLFGTLEVVDRNALRIGTFESRAEAQFAYNFSI